MGKHAPLWHSKADGVRTVFWEALPCFTDEETEVQQKKGIWPRTHNWLLAAKSLTRVSYAQSPTLFTTLTGLGFSTRGKLIKNTSTGEKWPRAGDRERVIVSPCLERRARKVHFPFSGPQFPQTVITGRKTTCQPDLSSGAEGLRRSQACCL